MPNPFIPRQSVHAWSEKIGETALEEQASLQRLLRDQRRLTRFLEENQADLTPASGGIAVYLIGVVARMFDLAGGRLKSATWAQVRDAASRVSKEVAELLPADDGFAERVRGVSWRAQPHILDEALMALFEREKAEDEEDLSPAEAVKVFFLLWVATEVLDANWKPARGFQGESTYEYVHIEPKAPEKASAEG